MYGMCVKTNEILLLNGAQAFVVRYQGAKLQAVFNKILSNTHSANKV